MVMVFRAWLKRKIRATANEDEKDEEADKAVIGPSASKSARRRKDVSNVTDEEKQGTIQEAGRSQECQPFSLLLLLPASVIDTAERFGRHQCLDGPVDIPDPGMIKKVPKKNEGSAFLVEDASVLGESPIIIEEK